MIFIQFFNFSNETFFLTPQLEKKPSIFLSQKVDKNGNRKIITLQKKIKKKEIDISKKKNQKKIFFDQFVFVLHCHQATVKIEKKFFESFF